jgi:hypothetical protein
MALIATNIAEWRWNDTPNDERGNHNAVLTGSTYDTSIKLLGSASLNNDGFNDNTVIADDAEFKSSDFSIVSWLYVPALGIERFMFMKQQSAAKSGYTFELFTDNKFYFQAGNGSIWPAYNGVSAAIGSTGWYMVVGRHSNSVHSISFNAGTPSSVSGGVIAHNTQDVWIGRNPDNPAIYRPSKVDQTMFFNKVLTTADEEELWNGGAGIELTSGTQILRRRIEGY